MCEVVPAADKFGGCGAVVVGGETGVFVGGAFCCLRGGGVSGMVGEKDDELAEGEGVLWGNLRRV